MKHSRFITTSRLSLLFAAGLFLLSSAPLFAQPERRIVPRHDFAVELPELGRMVGLEGDGLFGDKVYPVGDVNNDGLHDWILTRNNRDTMIDGKNPSELLLYLGVEGGVPDVADRIRIGPSEIGVNQWFMAAGDWDGDSKVDIATVAQFFRDTTFGPSNGKPGAHLVIWWGDGTGVYSEEDTTHLENGMDAWVDPDEGFSVDLNEDGVEDLILSDVKGFLNKEVTYDALVQVWIGSRDERFGRELPRRSTWQWWSPPRESRLNVFHRTQWIDQDVDGHLDFVWYTDGRGGGVHGTISIIYGTPDHILDTANIVSNSLDSAWGKYALFADITGDRVPELLVNTGGQEALKAYVGFKGQRLLEQYGLGNEPGHPGEDVWWGKPWATIPLPGQLHDGWATSGWSPVYNLGDGGLDGIGDFWVSTTPDVVCYNGGERLDSLYDAWINVPGGIGTAQYVVNLGDITGQGYPTFAVEMGSPVGVKYVQPTHDVPTTGKYRYLPPGTENPDSYVSEDRRETGGSFGLAVRPNPTSGNVQIEWTSQRGKATVSVSDQVGQVIYREKVDALLGALVWNASRTFGGSYWVTIEIDGKTETRKIQIQR